MTIRDGTFCLGSLVPRKPPSADSEASDLTTNAALVNNRAFGQKRHSPGSVALLEELNKYEPTKSKGRDVSPRLLWPFSCFILLGCIALLGSAPPAEAPSPQQPESPPPAQDAAPEPKPTKKFQAGVCWVGPAETESLRYLQTQAVDWVSVTPFAYGHRTPNDPPEGGYKFSRFPGESIEGVRAVIQQSHKLDLKVMLKPHVWFAGKNGWRADIAMKTEEQWQTWFAMYKRFLQPFLEMARDEKVAIFCLGTELAGTVHRKEWRELIAEIRKTYTGKLTYAANWYDEVDKVCFWHDVDFVGVQAYYPITESDDPSVTEIAAGWKPWTKTLEQLANKTKRPILFTEFGYKPVLGTTIRPWEWRSNAERSPEAQAKAYEGAFRALEDKPWLHGLYVWKWFSGYTGGGKGRFRHDNFSPQGAPAETTMKDWFRKVRGK